VQYGGRHRGHETRSIPAMRAGKRERVYVADKRSTVRAATAAASVPL
jgi:hypothetical protein